MFCIHMTTALQDLWVRDSECRTLEEMAAYILKNERKLTRVAGPIGGWEVYDRDRGRTLFECSLSQDEIAELERLIAEKRRGAYT